MNELTTSSAAIEAQPIGQKLFARFLVYLDRAPKTTRTYLTNLRQFFAWTLYAGATRPERQHVIDYREWLTSEHDSITLDAHSARGWAYILDRAGNRRRIACKPNTVKQYLQSVKQFFAWTATEGIYPNIAVNVHAPKVTDAHRKDSLTPLEVLTVEKSIVRTAAAAQAAAGIAIKDKAGRTQRAAEQGKRLLAVYLLAVNAGLRTVEISRANVRDLERKNGNAYLYVWGKGHTEPDAKKPIAPAVYEAIRDYLRSRADNPKGTSPLFVATGNRSHAQRLAPTTISKLLKHAMQAAGYDSERLTAHSLRHTAGQSVMTVTGDNIYQTQLYMRHTSPKTTEIYLENNSTQTDAAIAQRLFDYYHGEQTQTAENKLQTAIQTMNPAQLEQLTAIAAAMTNKCSA